MKQTKRTSLRDIVAANPDKFADYKKLGLFQVDGESVYVALNNNGDMEFNSPEALVSYLKEDADWKLCGYLWVTDNDPIEIESIGWSFNYGYICGNRVITFG